MTSLLQRGIGWYLDYEDIKKDASKSNYKKLQEQGDLNPGHYIGYTIGAAYVIWPLDFIPDFLPVIGQMDDLAVFMTAGKVGGLVYDILDTIF